MRIIHKQFLKFSIVGGVNTLIDLTVYTLLTRFAGLHYLLANIFAFLVAVTNSFVLNRSFTFKIKERKRFDYFKFFLVSTGSLIISESVLYFSVHFLNFSDIYGKIFAVGFSLIWNFIGSRYFVFRNRHEN